MAYRKLGRNSSNRKALFRSILTAFFKHDNNGQEDQHLAIGEGNISWNDIFTAIKQSAPQARLIFEYADTTMPKLLSNIKIVEKKYLS